MAPDATNDSTEAWPGRSRHDGSVVRRVGTRNVPIAIVVRTTMPEVHYADMFTLHTSATATPEEWARAMFGETPTLTGRFIWCILLRFRLASGRSPTTVAGWQVRTRGTDGITLEAESPILTGNLVVTTSPGRVCLGTFLHHRRPAGRRVWSLLSPIHRRLAPGLLRDAAAKIRAGG